MITAGSCVPTHKTHQHQQITRYLNEKEVSQLTGLALSTIRNDRCRVGRRRIPYVKVGKAVRYLESDVIAFMEAHRIEATGWTRGAK